MTAIERAEALLEAVSLERECTGLVAHGDCAYCSAWESLDALGLNRDTLRGYIAAVKALEDALEVFDPTEETAWATLAARPAIADFERLFPETSASAD